MALRFCDSFDHYATADITTKWSAAANAAIVAAGRLGGNCLRFQDDADYVSVTLDSQATWIVGFAYNQAAFQTSSYPVRFYDGATLHVDLRVDEGSQAPYFTRNGTELARSTYQMLPNVWYYVEVKVTIHDSTGSVYLRVNGVEWIAATGLDTRNGAAASANVIRFSGVNGNKDSWFDDLYVCDATGTTNNDFLGDIRVECLLPTADGATADWTASAGSDYTCVDEAAQNGDTDYISSSTANQVDTFAMGNLATTAGTIQGVQYLLMARKDDAGSRSVAPVARPASTDRVGATVSVGSTYAYVREIAELNPEDSAAWEIADINGMEYGVKLIA